jgi:threonine/homoserine/homoserine lactone efflux protein
MRSAAEFALAAGLLTLIPGPDTLLTVRTAITFGRANAVAAAAGICTALLAWGCAAGLGLTAALAAAPGLYLALRWAGAAYLAGLGLHSIIRGARWSAGTATASTGSANPGPANTEPAGTPTARTSAAGTTPGRRWPSYLRGVVTCASNPKVGIFYLALFPQFITPGQTLLPASLLLAAIHAAETLVWLSTLAALGGRLGRLLRRRSARRWADRISGAAFLAFAARLAAGG